MKKKTMFMLTLIIGVCIGFSSCTNCNGESKSKDKVVKGDANGVLSELVVENLISVDRQDMFINHKNDEYRWFETCIKLKDYLDAEGNEGTIEEVVNVFQVVIGKGKSFDTKVFKYQHFADGKVVTDSIDGFWIEDYPLNDEKIKLTYKDAYEKLMKANIVKPHSRYVTLRKQVGPMDANPQYIFGNVHQQVYVDAITGEVSGINPAFPKFNDKKALEYAFNWLVSKGKGELDKPLGEWP